MSRRFWIGFGLVLTILMGASLVTGVGPDWNRTASVATASPTASTKASIMPTATPAHTPTPTLAPTPVATSVPIETQPPSVNVSGGAGNSRGFLLSGLRYVVDYRLNGSCQYFAELKSADGSYDNTDFIQDNGPGSGSKYLQGRLVGWFYVAMSLSGTGNGCTWSMTFVPS